jgi:hypothetical protein
MFYSYLHSKTKSKDFLTPLSNAAVFSTCSFSHVQGLIAMIMTNIASVIMVTVTVMVMVIVMVMIMVMVMVMVMAMVMVTVTVIVIVMVMVMVIHVTVSLLNIFRSTHAVPVISIFFKSCKY